MTSDRSAGRRRGLCGWTTLSLDLEGMELEALQGLDFKRFKPALVIVEDRLDNLSRHHYLKGNGADKLVLRKFRDRTHWYAPEEPHAAGSCSRNKTSLVP